MPEPKARGDGRPFDLPGGPDAALLLHGLTGSPFEVRYLAERLHQAFGIRCRGPVLPGHESPEALARVPWREWMDGARRELLALDGAGRTLVVGCSMGALLACALARDYASRVDGLVLLAPALRLTFPGRAAAWLARHTPLARVMPFSRKRSGPDVADGAMRALNPCLDAVPLASVVELSDLAAFVDALLPEVRAPALVVAGGRDHTVSLAGVRRMAGRLGGETRLVVLPRSQHLVGIDVERDRCAEEARLFLDALPARPAAVSAR
ncbi:MAG TPA: alpha/beta fold hydrolase [Anaeromyxobacteraceae bacterium]|nr:alpha/beta fold hydrolase [Anaeromyxobacteraceae bacterium]